MKCSHCLVEVSGSHRSGASCGHSLNGIRLSFTGPEPSYAFTTSNLSEYLIMNDTHQYDSNKTCDQAPKLIIMLILGKWSQSFTERTPLEDPGNITDFMISNRLTAACAFKTIYDGRHGTSLKMQDSQMLPTQLSIYNWSTPASGPEREASGPDFFDKELRNAIQAEAKLEKC
ncbi:hypothetical protein E5288_WYG001337 [Bos mutus]|uniref:Uncharacterized protein n=1 Tax=Bos mutus TaxID=72004 RepID=A0A6B0R9G8_9CETA|nr:hypothetical protein [Bos mutus]